MTEKFSLKDYLFNEKKVQYLAGLLAKVDRNFKEKDFVAEVMSRMLELELKDRIRWITEVLGRYLPMEYQEAVAMMLASLPPPLDPTKTDDDFGSFIFAPFGEYVATKGCTKEYLEISLHALEELTMRFSMEDAIRYFLRAFPKETLSRCIEWTAHPNYHVRRLVSEGTRPLLPWSGKVVLDASETLALLTLLHADTTRYVTRSVANHLNDITKHKPRLVISILKQWQKSGLQTEKELVWMTKHALRTLIKRGDKEALALLGYGTVEIEVNDFSIKNSHLAPGDIVDLSVKLSSRVTANVLVDYVVHFVKKNGTTAPKVFKWKTLQLKAGESVTLGKRHILKADATTFTLYPGKHMIELQINGVKQNKIYFDLK